MNYLLIFLAVVIGILVAALKLQGSRLHLAQIKLLSQAISNSQDPLDKAVQVAKNRLNEELKAYRESRRD